MRMMIIKIKNKDFFCRLLICFFQFKCSNQKDAEKLLDDVSSTLTSFENFSFDFSYVLENRPENIKQETKWICNNKQ